MVKGIVFIAAAALLFAQTKPQPRGTVQRIKVHGKSLEGNLEGDSPDRYVSIYLPPGYDANRNRRYPVVYLLHGYFLTDQYWTGTQLSVPPVNVRGANVPAAMDDLIARGEVNPMIIVMPNAHTVYNGSVYSSSVTTGDWETFIAEDLVAYLDTHFRTIPDRSHRGLGGHSMGGYGTIRIGMKRPDVFSSLYFLSACCLMNEPLPPEAGKGGIAQMYFAWAAAYSPNPKNPPRFFDEPVIEGRRQSLVIARWHAASPLAMMDQYVVNLRKYQAIRGDVGLQDQTFGLLDQNRQIDQRMTDFEIPHTFEFYEGDHMNKVAERVRSHVLPFFSKNLAGKQASHQEKAQ